MTGSKKFQLVPNSFKWFQVGSGRSLFSKYSRTSVNGCLNRSKTKKLSKTQLDETNLPLIISLVSISPLHVRRRLPYIKDDSSEKF